MTEFEMLLACYRSGQVSERQWQEHLKDRAFREWVEVRAKEAAMPDRVIMVRESTYREMQKALTWYKLRTRACRSFADEGETARHALHHDGGKRAEAALAKAEAEPCK